MKRRLLPCPFCGEIPRREFGYTCLPDGREGRYLLCRKCGMEGPIGETRGNACEAWNRRIRISPKDWMPKKPPKAP